MPLTNEILPRAILGMRAIGSAVLLHRPNSTPTRTWVEEEYQRTENELGGGGDGWSKKDELKSHSISLGPQSEPHV